MNTEASARFDSLKEPLRGALQLKRERKVTGLLERTANAKYNTPGLHAVWRD